MPCTEEEKAYKRDEYAWYKAHKVCVVCHCRDAFEGYTVCRECLYRRQARTRTKPTDDQKARYNASKNEKRKAWIAQGLCSVCGKPVMPGYKMCVYHYNLKRKQQRKRLDGKKTGYYELGLCRICGAEPVPGKHYCEKHLAEKQEEAAHARQFIDREEQRRKKK